MNKKVWYKLAAVFLIIVMAGCSAVPAQPQRDADSLKRLVDTASPLEYPYAFEYPAIDADIDFGGSIAASVSDMAVKKAPAEVRAVWISFLEFQRVLTGKSESQFRSNVSIMFENCKNYGINTVIIQVRPYADALYSSRYFPWSHIATGSEGADPGFDPLSIMTVEARKRGLRIEAWVNPYRIRSDVKAKNNKPLSADNQAKKWLDAKDDSVILYNNVLSYNPASTKAQSLIINGVVELVKNYDIDGIHIDDYFYPTTDKAFDKSTYTAYTSNGGRLSLEDWRRANVESLLKKMYSAIKSVNKNMLFGISPQSSVYNNYNAHYLDVEKIASTRGYCDYICPQIYFGFNNAAQPYSETLAQWNNMVTAPGVKLYVGLANYKVGAVDSWAGAGKNEWLNNTNVLKRMTEEARKTDSYGGIMMFRYDSIFVPASNVKSAVQKENSNLRSLFK